MIAKLSCSIKSFFALVFILSSWVNGLRPLVSFLRTELRSKVVRGSANDVYTMGQVIGPYRVKKIVLNDDDDALSIPDDDVSFDGPALAKELRFKMLEIKSEFMQDDGKTVDYKKAKSSQIFSDFVKLAKSLKRINLSSMLEHERKAFFINIYNCLIVHAIIDGLLDGGSGTVARLRLYASASYNICGLIFSLNDIENGVLRNNRLSAVPLTGVPFADSFDSRKSFMVKCDPRIHFALNCGALGCPPIAAYSADERILDAELTRATESFLDQSVELSPESKTVTLSMLFSWYKEDFGFSNDAIFDWIFQNAGKHLSGRILQFKEDVRDGRVRIKFAPYDWTLNSAPS